MIYEPSIRVITVGDEIRVQPFTLAQVERWELGQRTPVQRFYEQVCMVWCGYRKS